MLYIGFVIINLIFNVLAWVLSPVLPLFAIQQYGWINNHETRGNEPRLPWWLGWFQTPDNSLLGDDGHKTRWKSKPEHWQMAAWLVRNPAYGLAWGRLAANVEDGVVCYTGNPWIGSRQNPQFGKCAIKVTSDDGTSFWCWLYVRDLGVWLGERRMLKLQFGWELTPYAQDERRLTGKSVAMLKFSPRVITLRG